MERYELVDGKASKFWEVSVEGARLTVHYGRIGTEGQTKDKDFASGDAATKEKNRLVKEKTGKGYALVGSIAGPIPSDAPAARPAGEPKPKAAASAVPAQDDELRSAATKAPSPPSPSSTLSNELQSYLAFALPTRSRPQDGPEGSAAWTALRELLLPIMARTTQTQKAVRWLREHLTETGPVSVEAHEAALFIGNILEVANPLLSARSYGSENWWKRTPEEIARLACMTHFMNWLTAGVPPNVIVDMAAGIIMEIQGRIHYQERSGWSSVPALALRAAVVRTAENYYQQLITHFEMTCASLANPTIAAHIAFILADDRATQHDLQPLAVLNAAEAAGENIAESPTFLPLILDSPPSRVAHLWARRSDFPSAFYCETRLIDAAATAVAVARHYGEAAQPTLDWLYQFAAESAKTELAQLILALDESESFPAQLLETGDKHVRTALDRALKVAPARTFRQCLTAVASGQPNALLTARIMAVISSQKPETLRQWAGTDATTLSCLERLLEGLQDGRTLAAPESWPDVLRDPPWRKKATAEEDIVLKLEPIATPFTYQPGKEQKEHRPPFPYIVDSTDALLAYIDRCETKAKRRPGIPAPTVPPPQPGESEDQVVKWLDQRLSELYHVGYHAIAKSNYINLLFGIEQQPEALSLMLWQSGAPMEECGYGYMWRDCFPAMMARFGEKALPGFLRQIEANPVLVLEYALSVGAGDIAPHAARALFKLKKARAQAMLWLRKYRKTAILRLIPDALGAKGETRDAAEHALRWIAANTDSGRTKIENLATEYASTEPRVGEALAQVLDRNHLGRYPARIAKLPVWFVPSALHRPELVGGGALPDEAVTAFTEMLSFSTPDAVYAGIAIVRQQITRASCATFAWDLFSAWLANGAPAKDGWAMRALGWLGDDECARRITQLIRKWPGESAHARAVTGLDVLVDIGSDIALMNLNGIAEKLKFKGLQEKAREKIAALAEARDLTPEELSDRLAPDLDLDERGGLDLIFGERRFRAGFDEFLKPWVKDATGQRLKDLPKPNKSDDAELSAKAVERWKALKKDARSIASLQITRLENMLSTSRRTAPDAFWTFFASHPLIRHLAQRLVWGVYADDNPRTRPTTTFRITDDLSFTSSGDTPLDIDVSEGAAGRIGLVHPLHLPPQVLEAWGALFGDYEIAQPFPQLSREIFELTEEEKGRCEIARFEGVTVEATRMRGVVSRGWRLGEPQDAGLIHWIEREVRMEDGTVSTATLDFAEGRISAGSPEYDDAPKLGTLTLEGAYRGANSAYRFGQLDPVGLSELLRGLHLLIAAETT